MIIETHCHTTYSKQKKIKWEGINTPAEMVERADRIGLDALCITDHDSISAWPEAMAAGKKHGIVVIPGEEVSSADGHIIGLGLNELVPKGLSAEETIDFIHDQGGISIAAHPFDVKGLGIRNKMEHADVIEIFNSLNLEKVNNWFTKRTAKKMDKPMVAGSDAHSAEMLGMSRNFIEEADDVDSVLRAIKSGNITPSRTDYHTAPVLIEWVRERMNLSYMDILEYVNENYAMPKANISKYMLDKFLYSENRALGYTWHGLTKFAVHMATLYGGVKLLTL